MHHTTPSLKVTDTHRVSPPNHTTLEVMTIVPASPSFWGVTRSEIEDGSYSKNAEYLIKKKQVTDACKQYGGFYLGSIGGAAALLGRDCITDVQLLEYPELGMEAIYMITVKDFPAFVIVDDKGNDFFQTL